jgi:hypothetical protein
MLQLFDQDEEEEVNYEDIIQCLTDGTFPATASSEHQKCIKERSKCFSISDGVLYYSPSTRSSIAPRQVLLSTQTRQDAILAAHIGTIYILNTLKFY